MLDWLERWVPASMRPGKGGEGSVADGSKSDRSEAGESAAGGEGESADGEEDVVERLGAAGMTLFFVGGFVFDALTIGRYVNLYTLSYVGVYALGVGVAMVIRARRWFESWREWVDGALHFCLGAVFSALVCLYFRSAGHLWGFITVAILAGMMVYNEYAAHKRPRRSIIWGIYGASLVMYFNFLLPYLFRSLSAWWFYGSIALALGMLYALRHLADIPHHSLIASAGFSAVLVVLYLFGAVPPVPLVMKQNIAGVNAEKRDGEYVCRVNDQSLWASIGLVEQTVRYAPGERVSVLSAVSAPGGVETRVAHRWREWQDGEWRTRDTVELEMWGGRDEGWRFFSYKQNVSPGYWRVDTVVHQNSLLSSETFYLEEVESADGLERSEARLR